MIIYSYYYEMLDSNDIISPKSPMLSHKNGNLLAFNSETQMTWNYLFIINCYFICFLKFLSASNAKV